MKNKTMDRIIDAGFKGCSSLLGTCIGLLIAFLIIKKFLT